MKLWVPIMLLVLTNACVERAQLGPSAEISVLPSIVPADGNSYATVRTLVTDAAGPIDTPLRLQSSDANAQITQFGAADANGWFTAEIRSVSPGTQTLSVTVTSGDVQVPLPVNGLVTFNSLFPPAGRAYAQTSGISANPNTVADDGSAATQVSVYVLDINNAPVEGAAVTFASTGTNNFFSIDFGLTDANGTLTTALASTSPGIKTVTAYVDSIAVATQVNFSPLASSVLFSTLTENPQSVTADGVSTTLLTLTLRDLAGLPLPGAPVAWSSTGTNNTLVPAASVTDSNGMATATLASTTAEVKTIAVTSGPTLLTQSATFLPGSISARKCTFVANPSLLTADDISTAVLTFTALDAHGNPIPAAPVSLTVTGSDNNVMPLSGTTNGAGQFIATLSSGKSETKIVTAVSGNVTLNQTLTFLAGVPSAATSTLAASSNTVTADGTSSSTLTLTVEDAQGNPVSGQAVTFSATGTNNSFAQTTGVTDASGQFVTTVTSTTAEDTTIIATFAGTSASAGITFVSGAPASSMTTLFASPTTVVANGTSTTQLTVTVLDAYGNAVPNQSVVLSSTGTNNVFDSASGTTDSAGMWTATMASTTAEIKTVTATAGSAKATAAVTFVAGAPSGTTTTFVATPTSVTADGTSQSTLTLTVEDAYGNPVPGVTVNASSTGTLNTLSASVGTTNASGIFVTTLASTKAETKTITATAGSVTETANVTFVAGAPSSTTTTLVANPNTVRADDSTTTTVTMTVLDAQGNPVANQAVSLTSTGANNVFGSASGTTNGAGVYITTLASSTAQVKSITGTAGTATANATVTFVSGAPSSANCTLSAAPTSLTADGVSTTQLTFLVEDTFGNPVANQAVSLTSTGTSNVITPASGTTNSSGTFVATMASTKAEVKSVTGTAGSATATTTVTFKAGAVSSATTTLVVNPNTVAADGSTTSTLVTTAFDAQGNPVAGQSVSMSTSGVNSSFSSASGSTDASGVFTTTVSSTTVQTETLSALVGGTVTVNANVTFTTPVVSPANSTIAANPNSLIANGNDTSMVTVTVADGAGAPIVNAVVTMSATGSSNVFSPASGTTNSLGVFTTTLTSTQAGLKKVTATVDGAALNTNVAFLAGPPDSATTTLMASPNTVTADGTSTTTITVLVEDAYGNPVPNQAVSLNSTGTNNTFSQTSGTSDATGAFTVTLASTMAQTKTVTATVNGFNEVGTVTFVAGNVSGATTTLVASPNTATPNGAAAITFTVSAKDVDGNPVANQTVVLSSTGSNNNFAPPSGSTNSAGIFIATMTSTMAQAKTVTATLGTVSENTNVLFVAGAPSASTSTLRISLTSVTANGNTATMTVTVQDAQGNPIANQNVAFSGSGTANVFNPATGSTNGSGVLAATLSSTVAQTEIITASVGSVNLTASITFTAGPANSGTSTLVASPTTVTANGSATSTLTVTVKDVYGNPVANQAVSLNSNGTNNTFSMTSGSTNGSGIFTSTLASTTAQAKLVTATVGTFNETAGVTFTPGAPSNGTTTLAVSPSSITADGVTTATLTMTVEDAYGNAVPNQTVTLSASGMSTNFSPASGTTNAIGIFTATVASTVAQTETITATAGPAQATASMTFTAGVPASATSQVSANPNVLTANGTSVATVTVTVLDAHGNPVPNQSVSVGANGTGNTWGSTSGTTNGSGVWITSMASTVEQVETITATIGMVTETTTISFLAGPANSGTSTLTANPTTVTADGSSTSSLQVTVRDAQGNGVNGQAVTFSSTGTGYTFSAATCSTDTSGLCSVTLKSTVAQTVTASANFAGVTETAQVMFIAGNANSATSALTINPNSLPDDGNSASTLQIALNDATGNPVAGQSVTFSSSGTGYSFSATTCNTNSSGLCAVTLKSTVAQTVTVTAGSASIAKTGTVTFVAGSPNSTTSIMTASPNAVTDNGTNTSTLQVTVNDATGNPINGQAVTFSSTGTGKTFSSTTCTTNSSGRCSVTVTSTVAGTATITAAFAGATVMTMVTFNTGAPSSNTSFLTASPNAVADDGVATSTLQVSVEDSTVNPINAQAVTFSSTGSSYTFSSTTCTTNSSGICSVTLVSTVAQTVTVTASFASSAATAVVKFLPGSASSSTSTVTASPNSVPADGNTPSTITVTARDATGNLLANTSVSLNGTGTSNNFAAANGNTNAFGVYSTTLTSTVVQTESVTALIGGTSTVSTTMIFAAAATPSLANSSYIASPNTNVPADGNMVSTLTVTVNDATGHPIGGQAVTFTSTGSNNTLNPNTGVTNASGQFSTTIKSTTAQTDVTTVSFAGLSMNANVVFVAGTPTHLVFTTSPTTSSVGPCVLATGAVVTIEDAYGNTCTNENNIITIAIGTNPGAGTLEGTATAWAIGGVASFTTLAISEAGTGYTLAASYAGLTGATSASFNVSQACSSDTNSTVIGISALTGITSGDVNHDGAIDLLVGSSSNKQIKVLYNNGKGVFSSGFLLSATATFENFVSPDFNGDGWADLAMNNSSAASNSGVVYLNSKSASPFTSSTNVGLSANSNTIRAMDVNRDGKLDLIAGGTNISWVVGNGSGGFSAGGTLTGTSPDWYPWVSDLDNDGVWDYYAYTSGSSSFSSTYFNYSSNKVAAAAYKALGAGVVYSHFTSVWLFSSTSLYYRCHLNGNGSGSDGLAATSGNGQYLDLVDFTGTGVLGIVLTSSNGISAHTISSVCTVSAATSYSTGTHSPVWATVADFNGDGIPDFATANSDGTVTTIIVP